MCSVLSAVHLASNLRCDYPLKKCWLSLLLLLRIIRTQKPGDKTTQSDQLCGTWTQDSAAICSWYGNSHQGFPDDLVVKNLPPNAGEVGSILELRRSHGNGNSNPFQYPCLKNPVERGTWRATLHEVTKESELTWQLNNRSTEGA